MQYPSDIKIIIIPCTGKIDILHMLHAFEKGADGVYVVGCMEGDCHYTNGNIRARNRVKHLKKILDTIGVGGERVQMYNLSSNDGPRFADIAVEMDDKIRKLGPNPIKLSKNRAP